MMILPFPRCGMAKVALARGNLQVKRFLHPNAISLQQSTRVPHDVDAPVSKLAIWMHLKAGSWLSGLCFKFRKNQPG